LTINQSSGLPYQIIDFYCHLHAWWTKVTTNASNEGKT